MRLGSQWVTVYRMEEHGLKRQILSGCHYSFTDKEVSYERYRRHQRTSLLIVPSQADLQVGDRVLDGIGPETVDWDRFLPVTVPGLSQITWVKAVRMDGIVHHTEAGG